MTIDRAKTIEMAMQAESPAWGDWWSDEDALLRFAASLRAEVLEEAAQKCEQMARDDMPGPVLGRSIRLAAALRGMKSDSGHSAAADGCASTAPPTRTDADYAIEHAGYLATAARRFREAVNVEGLARIDDEEKGNEDTSNALDAARENVSEASLSLRSAIFEFEKRRDRAAAPNRKGADTGRHGSNVQAESASPSVLLIRGEK